MVTRRWGVGLAALALVATGGLVVHEHVTSPDEHEGSALGPSTASTPADHQGTAQHGTKARHRQARPLKAPAAPMRLVVPEIGVDSTVVPIQVSGGALDPPADASKTGWWDQSAKPGDRAGQTVLTGHTVHTGGGVMNDLGDVHDGARVDVVTPRGTMTYRVNGVEVLTKRDLAEQAEDLFAQDRRSGRLVLVTCTGWTGHDYTSNVVVFATPVRPKAA